MPLSRNAAGFVQVGLLSLVLLVGAARGQLLKGLSGGFRTGSLLSVTELNDKAGFSLQAFLRGHLILEGNAWEKWQGELSVGYGSYAGAGYSTDVALGEARVLYSPITRKKWDLFLYGGVGFLRYDLVTLSPQRTPDAAPIGWGMIIPAGLGFQFELFPNSLLEVNGCYVFTSRDDLNGATFEIGNDVFWNLMAGLTIRRDPPSHRKPPPSQVVSLPLEQRSYFALEFPGDQDGDGLEDREEKWIHFTNPVMADSDGDGLGDGDEVKDHRTDPNNPDTDGGGIGDGDEVGRDTDPLDEDDDMTYVALSGEGEVTGQQGERRDGLPIVFFTYGGTTLTRKTKKDLDGVAKALLRNQEIVLEVRGYSDSSGRSEANLRLSRRRAQVVKDYLVEQGVPIWRLTVKTLGEEQPIAPNTTPEGRQKNQRVELVPVESR